MSGRVPPKAPRALLNSLAVSGTAASSSSSATAPNVQPSSSSRIGAAPPTGPRSLSSVGPLKTKHLVNGLSSHIVPAIPSSLKGKQVDYGGGFRVVNSTAAPNRVNGNESPHESHPPLSQPPPLPPSGTASTSQLPPPPSFDPPPLPSPSTSSAPCPPTSAPPALPPPPTPDTVPPPLPSLPDKPHIPPIAFLKSLKPNSILRSRSPSTPPASPSRLPSPPTPVPPSPSPAVDISPSPRPLSPAPSPPPPAPPPSPPKLYSLPPPLPWPPFRSEYQSEIKDFRVLYDPAVDKDRDGRLRQLIEKIRQLGLEGDQRIKGKSKGKELLYRYEGEVVDGEQPPVIRDPRKATLVKRLPNLRPGRSECHTLKYEFDANSTGPPPPTCVLVLNISPLTPNQQIRRHFSVHGRVVSFEPQIDKQTGGPLGIVFVRFSTHEEAKKCVERENGGRNIGVGTTLGIQSVDGEELKVVLDSEDKVKLKAVLKELDDRKKRERDEILKRKKDAEEAEKRKKEEEAKAKKEAEAVQQWRVKHSVDPRQRPTLPQRHPLPPHPGVSPLVLPSSNAVPSSSLIKARPMNPNLNVKYSSRPTLSLHDHSSSSTPSFHYRGRPSDRSSDRYYRSSFRDRYSPSKRSPSRSPSPISRKPGHSSRQSSRQIQRDLVLAELKKNGNDYVSVEEYGGGGQLGGNVKEEDVRKFFGGFKVDKVLQDHLGWYVTFLTADSARKACTVLNSSTRTLAHRSVTLTVHAPPLSWTSSTSVTQPTLDGPSSKTKWNDDELVSHAEGIIMKELKALLEKDVMDRVIGVKLRHMAAEAEKARKQSRVDGGSGGVDMEEKKGLKGLSFKKNKPKPILSEDAVVKDVALEEDEEEEVEAIQRPKKKRKTTTKVTQEDVESEESDEDDIQRPRLADVKRKRSEVEDEIDEPTKKKLKAQVAKKPGRKPKIKVVISEEVDFDAPAVAEIQFSPWESSLSPPSSPEPEFETPPSFESSPPPDPLRSGLCEDDEDLYFAKLALARLAPIKFRLLVSSESPSDEPEPKSPPPFRVHTTGSARSEGYYKISHSEKSAYVDQYANRTFAQEAVEQVEVPAQQKLITSSRSNRANARRRAQGIEEINQVQRALKLSMGETPATDQIKFNQLQTRKKQLRFARSPIHDWGLYAMERISRGEMVIEYVGEVIRAQVADKREKAYERQGIGSSYLFRIDEDLVVDATKKGNLGRLINHSCDPNCTAKIITINGEKKIVIYAKQDIELGDEITYDYHFPIEQDKIPCLCGSAKCRGYLN